MRAALIVATFLFSGLTHALPAALHAQDLSSGKSVMLKLRNLEGKKGTVVVFLSARCPCSMSHEDSLKKLQTKYGSDCQFVAIHSNADESAECSQAHFGSNALSFPVLQDTSANFADAFGALKTPHAFVVNSRAKCSRAWMTQRSIARPRIFTKSSGCGASRSDA